MQTITTEEDYQTRKEQFPGIKEAVRLFRAMHPEPPPGEPTWQLLYQTHEDMLSDYEKDLAEWEARQVKMQEVVSSNIAAAGYTPGPDGKPGNLYVDFKGTTKPTRYVYADVPEDVYQALLDATSAGQFLNQHIKGTYAARKVE